MFFQINDVKEISIGSNKELFEQFDKHLSSNTENVVQNLLSQSFEIPQRILDKISVETNNKNIKIFSDNYYVIFEFNKKYSIEKYIELIKFINTLDTNHIDGHIEKINELKEQFIKLKNEVVTELRNIINKSIIDPEIQNIVITRINGSVVKFLVQTKNGLKIVSHNNKIFSIETNKMFSTISNLMNDPEFSFLDMSFEIFNRVD